MSSERRARVESMALQALFRWPNIAKEIGLTPNHFLNRAEERALAASALDRVALAPNGTVPLANAAADAGVTLDWIRSNFVATFFDPSQGRAWMEELEELEYARQLSAKIDHVVTTCRPGELDDAVIGVTRQHQRDRRRGKGSLLNMEDLTVAYLNDQDERGEEMAALPIGDEFPSLTWALRGGWHRDECTGIIAGGGTGKGLALNTIIPTPSGYRNFESLTVGDSVFSDLLAPCQITYVSENHLLPCYRLVFHDGSVLIADDEHLWATSVNGETSAILSTQEIFASGCSHTMSRGSSTFQLVSIEPVPPVITRCIMVDSPSHLFLAGEAGIPTHNTTLGECFRRLLAQRGVYTINFNAEMTKKQMAERFVYAEARMSPTQQMDAATRSEVRHRIMTSGVAKRMRVYDASHLSPEAMERAIETEKELVGAIGLFVVDHSTKVGNSRDGELKEWEVISRAAITVKNIVKTTEVAGVLLAHMTTSAGAQEDPNWQGPTAADIAGGKIMYKEMDNLVAIWRTPGGATWGKILKARMNGQAKGMKFRLIFDVPTQSYSEAPGEIP